MRKKASSEEIFKAPPPNACAKCWETKRGVYMSLPVFLKNPREDRANIFLCHKAVCPYCGDIKLYTDKDGNIRPGIYRLTDCGADFKMEYWAELKGVDLQAFIRLMLREPKRNEYSFDELARKVIGHRADFYEPKYESALL